MNSSPASLPSTLDARPWNVEHIPPGSTPPSDDEVLVRVEGVSKKFCRSLKKSLWYGVCDIAGELLPVGKRRGARDEGRELSDRSAQDISRSTQDTGLSTAAASSSDARLLDTGLSTLDSTHGLRPGEFWAVKDVSFELRRGECLGLIGHNGAGKTTLLKMLNGLIKPDAGSITMRGRVGALIALGAGFNPILTGRENIYINGSVLGLTKKEIDAKIDEIIDFAEIREFIDMPVQSYSSGMTVRLGFAVATALDPDVLILDEVLAVGDVAFRYKCYRRIDEIRNRAAILFVSHNMPDVGRICTETIVMEKGHPVYIGPPLGGVDAYNSLMNRDAKANKVVEEIKYPIKKFRIEVDNEIQFNNKLNINLITECECAIPDAVFTLAFINNYGGFTAIGSMPLAELGFELKHELNVLNILVKNVPLKDGEYFIQSHITDKSGQFIAMVENKHKVRVYGANKLLPGDCQLEFETLCN